MTPKRRNTRHDELPEVSTLSFERFGALADDLVSFYRGQDRKSIWTTGYDFVASEIRPRSFDSSIALLFQGEDGAKSRF